jgi:uncharacterized protein
MMPPHLRPVLLELRARLARSFGERFCDMRLFGSYARGEATEESDVDVLVLIDALKQAEIAVVADATTRLALETGVPLASLPMASERFTRTTASQGFVDEVERDGERP